jgi:hypothetical protein
LLPFVSDARGEDWPQWRGPDRYGAWHETGVMEAFPSAGLTVAWRALLGSGWSSSVVAAGRVFVTAATWRAAGSRGAVHAAGGQLPFRAI